MPEYRAIHYSGVDPGRSISVPADKSVIRRSSLVMITQLCATRWHKWHFRTNVALGGFVRRNHTKRESSSIGTMKNSPNAEADISMSTR